MNGKALPEKTVVMVSTCSGGGIFSIVRALQTSDLANHWPIRVVYTHDAVSLPGKLLLAARAYGVCLWLLSQRKVSLFHIHVAERGSLFRKSVLVILARIFGVPVIFHMHGAEYDDFYEACPKWVQGYIRWVLGGCDRIVALCESWADYYRRLTAAPVQVIPNFVEGSHAGFSGRPVRPGALDILYLGRFGERKGIYDLVKALQPLYAAYPGLRVRCGGDGDIEAVRDLVAQAGMQERFQILGWLGPDERNRLMDSSQVYVLPSYAEGLPMAIIEAMAAGLCIVSTRVGCIPNMVDDGISGWLVEPGDVAGLRVAFQCLLDDPALCSRMGEAARQAYLERFSPRAVVSQFVGLYRELLGPGA